jgi:hypothetical protein
MNRSFSISTTAALMIGLCLSLANSPANAQATVNACDLITLNDVNAIAEGDAKSATPRSNGAECSFQNAKKDAVLTVKVKSGGAKAAMQDAVKKMETTYKKPAKVVAGVGDEAHWVESLGTLHVLKGDTYVDLFFTRQKNRTEVDTVKAAKTIVAKLK